MHQYHFKENYINGLLIYIIYSSKIYTNNTKTIVQTILH